MRFQVTIKAIRINFLKSEADEPKLLLIQLHLNVNVNIKLIKFNLKFLQN